MSKRSTLPEVTCMWKIGRWKDSCSSTSRALSTSIFIIRSVRHDTRDYMIQRLVQIWGAPRPHVFTQFPCRARETPVFGFPALQRRVKGSTSEDRLGRPSLGPHGPGRGRQPVFLGTRADLQEAPAPGVRGIGSGESHRPWQHGGFP